MPARKNPGSACRSSANPCGATVPHECTFGSMRGASRRGASMTSSSSSRISRSMLRSGRKPVAFTTTSASMWAGSSWRVPTTVTPPTSVDSRCEISNESITAMRPAWTNCSTREPRAARSVSSSSGDEETRIAEALRMSHVARVAGSVLATSARAIRVFDAEWPAPTTTVCFPANDARSVPSTSGSAWCTRSGTSARPSGSSPDEASGFGVA